MLLCLLLTHTHTLAHTDKTERILLHFKFVKADVCMLFIYISEPQGLC